MTKEQARIEAEKIFQQRSDKADEIVKKAKDEGILIVGLDGNKDLFKELDAETKEKLKLLASMVDEE